MTSFSCPHFDCLADACLRLRAECVPGRPGCVLCKNSVFAVPWQERLAAKQKERQGSARFDVNESSRPSRIPPKPCEPARYQAVQPPSIVRFWPVMKLLASLARKTTAPLSS